MRPSPSRSSPPDHRPGHDLVAADPVARPAARITPPSAANDRRVFERVVGFLLVALLAFACLQITLPFLGPILWGVVIAVSTWPLYARLRTALNGWSKTAAAIMTLGLFIVLVAPVALLVSSLAESVRAVTGLVQDLAQAGTTGMPGWLAKLPLIGPLAATYWDDLVANLAGILQQIRPYIGIVTGWLLQRGASLGIAVLEFLVAVGIAGVLYVTGEAGIDVLRRFVVRIGGERQLGLVDLAGRTIRGVAQGVIGTAFVQAVTSAIGFAIAGAPGVTLLAFLTFFAALIQLPTAVIWLPVAAWFFFKGATGWAIFTVAWGVVLVNTVDNFVRPILISHGANLPLLLIFVGVLGGLLTWGFIGIFLGATLLAVGYTLFRDWLDEPEAPGN